MWKCCPIDGCEDRVHSKGLCNLHYHRQRRNGDALASGKHGGHTLAAPSAPPDPAPLIALRQELERHRTEGRSFDKAWPLAVSTATSGLPEPQRADWLVVLGAHRAIWSAAYRRAPARPFSLSPPEEARGPARRDGAPLVFSGSKHDAGRGSLEPAPPVPWCA